MKYIRSLEWEVRDSSSVLVPVKLLLSNISWAAKGIPRLKIPPELDEIETRASLVVCLNTIFRQIATRTATPHALYPIPPRFNTLFDHFNESFFERTFSREVGLKVISVTEAFSAEEDNEGTTAPSDPDTRYCLEFILKHPLYIYSRLAEVVIAPTSVDELP